MGRRPGLSDLGGIMLAHTPAEFGKLIAEDTVKWGKVDPRSQCQAGVTARNIP
jgi:hypothetical protein